MKRHRNGSRTHPKITCPACGHEGENSLIELDIEATPTVHATLRREGWVMRRCLRPAGYYRRECDPWLAIDHAITRTRPKRWRA